MNLEGLEEDVRALLLHREDGTVEVHKWTSEVPHHAFWCSAQACEDERQENEDLPRWTKKATVKVWSEMLEDHEARNDFMKSIMWMSTDFLKHVVGKVEERRTITFTAGL